FILYYKSSGMWLLTVLASLVVFTNLVIFMNLIVFSSLVIFMSKVYDQIETHTPIYRCINTLPATLWTGVTIQDHFSKKSFLVGYLTTTSNVCEILSTSC